MLNKASGPRSHKRLRHPTYARIALAAVCYGVQSPRSLLLTRLSAVRRALWLVILPVAIAATGCIHNFWRTVAVKVALPDTGTVAIRTPLKVHLVDGRTVVFRAGASRRGPGRHPESRSDERIAVRPRLLRPWRDSDPFTRYARSG